MNKQKGLAPIITLLIIIIVVGGVLGWQFFSRGKILSAEAAYMEIQESINKIKSYSFSSLITYKPTIESTLFPAVEYNSTGKVDIENSLAQQETTIKQKFNEKTNETKTETFLTKEALYFLIPEGEQKDSPLVEMFTEEALGKWMKIDFVKLAEKINEAKLAKVNKIKEETKENSEFSQKMLEGVVGSVPKEMDSRVKLITGEETLKGIEVYHYQVELIKEESDGITSPSEGISFIKQLMLPVKAEGLKLDIWIDKKEALIRKFAYSYSLKRGEEKLADFSFELEFFDYNKKLDLQLPQNYIDGIQFFEEKVAPQIEESKAEVRDALRKSEMLQIFTALEMYYDGAYPQSKNIPTSIGNFMPSVPKDKLDRNGDGEKDSYHWLDNTSGAITGCNSQHFCAWAELEGGGYFVISEEGTKELSSAPNSCPCVEGKAKGSSQQPEESAWKDPTVEITGPPAKEIASWQTWGPIYTITNNSNYTLALAFEIEPSSVVTSGAIVVDPDGDGPELHYYYGLGEKVTLKPQQECFFEISLSPPVSSGSFTPKVIFKNFNTGETFYTHEFAITVK